MDFFAAEGRAKKKTQHLLVLFALAVAGTVLAGYFAALFGLRFVHAGQTLRHGYGYGYSAAPSPGGSLWDPKIFAVVTVGTLAVIALASLYKWTEFRGGGSAVAESVGGRRVDPHTTDPREHQLLNVVEEMAIASGLPVPAVFILDDEPGINAFAAGLTTSDAVVTVTRGTLEKLSRDELQGVVAHEFSHILNGDMRINLRVSAIIFGILLLGLAGRAVLWSLRFGRVGGSRDEKGSNGTVLLILGGGVALLLVGYVGYFFGRLIQASLSRQREFLADASAVQFTRNPPGVTNALKKIGGYAIGSSMETHRAAEISHFFFAQAFASNFGGLWATHPPLDARIRAIDPSFDGRMIEPPETVDVARQPWSQVAGMAPAAAPRPADGAALGAALAAAAGTLTPEATQGAQALLTGIPASLRAAARSPHDAEVLVYGLLLDDDEEVRGRQLAALAAREGGDVLRTLEQLEPALRGLDHEHRLPVLQLALPALKALPPSALGTFAGALDDLVRADGRVTTFEYALQRIVLRALAISRSPSAVATQVFSFQAVTHEISVVLSALAHASSADDAEAAKAFVAGAAQLPLVQASLAYLPAADSSLALLDAALDKLAVASGPIKQRVLVAGAHVVGADGILVVEEVELLRAVAASLDVPVPPLITG